MRVYQIKKLIEGNKIRLVGKYVAVPSFDYDSKITYDNGEPFTVRYFNDGVKQEMEVENFKLAKTYRTFPDRKGRGNYVLGYFLWTL